MAGKNITKTSLIQKIDTGIKPMFLSKKKREELKKQEEKQQKSQQLSVKKQIVKKRRDFLRAVKENKETEWSHKIHFRDERTRDKERERDGNDTKENKEKQKIVEQKEKNKELLIKDIKDTYLGRKKRQKRVIPMNHKQRFCFDWEPNEDTSADLNELYDRKADVTLAFGRGFIAGTDRVVQKEKNSVYGEMLRKHKAKDVAAMQRIMERKEERVKRMERKRLERKRKHHVWKAKKLEEMTPRDWRILREDFGISVRGEGVFYPLRSWKEAVFEKALKDALKKVGYRDPSPIQRIAIPIGLAKRDIVGIAETGSGKTCAFVIPMLSHIFKMPPMTAATAANGPYAIILAPSRELAEQIEAETRRFADPMGIKTVSIIGGTSMDNQALNLRAGVEIIIATPGRLCDCLERKFVVLNQCNYIVLDEADRMIDLGFEPQVVEIFDRMPSTNLRPEDPAEAEAKMVYRQTIMFSATMPPAIEKLAKKYLRDPLFVTVGERFGSTAKNVQQRVVFAGDSEKRKLLQEILERSDPPIMVFCNHKKQCDVLVNYYNSQGHNCASLHGGKSQESRSSALKAFRDHDIDILICTDVAGRGIDVKNVTHVVNYDMPKNIEYYTHRIGRTGRAGAEGQATTFLSAGDEDMFYHLKKLLVESSNIVPPELANHPAAMQAPATEENQKK